MGVVRPAGAAEDTVPAVSGCGRVGAKPPSNPSQRRSACPNPKTNKESRFRRSRANWPFRFLAATWRLASVITAKLDSQ